MDILPTSSFDKLKRYWKRRSYQRVNDASKKKLKVARLGNRNRAGWKIRSIPKLRFKIVSPIKLLTKFHDAYVDMMIRLAGEKRKKTLKISQPDQLMVSTTSDEIVDSNLVLEMYKRLVSTRELAALLV